MSSNLINYVYLQRVGGLIGVILSMKILNNIFAPKYNSACIRDWKRAQKNKISNFKTKFISFKRKLRYCVHKNPLCPERKQDD